MGQFSASEQLLCFLTQAVNISRGKEGPLVPPRLSSFSHPAEQPPKRVRLQRFYLCPVTTFGTGPSSSSHRCCLTGQVTLPQAPTQQHRRVFSSLLLVRWVLQVLFIPRGCVTRSEESPGLLSPQNSVTSITFN